MADDMRNRLIKEMLKRFEFEWKDALWQHKQSGEWLMKHKYVEIVGAKLGVQYSFQVVECDSANGNMVVICTAKTGDKTVQTFGEANTKNNKTSYPMAMAEKRAYDRAVLKVVGLHGFIYSETEFDD